MYSSFGVKFYSEQESGGWRISDPLSLGGTMLVARIRLSSPASLPFPDMSKMEQTDVSADRQTHPKVQIAHPRAL